MGIAFQSFAVPQLGAEGDAADFADYYQSAESAAFSFNSL
jgi:hypothetical protein